MNQTWWIHEITRRYFLGEIDATASSGERSGALFRAIQKLAGATLFRARDLTLGLPDSHSLSDRVHHIPESAWSVTVMPLPFDPSPSNFGESCAPLR